MVELNSLYVYLNARPMNTTAFSAVPFFDEYNGSLTAADANIRSCKRLAARRLTIRAGLLAFAQWSKRNSATEHGFATDAATTGDE